MMNGKNDRFRLFSPSLDRPKKSTKTPSSKPYGRDNHLEEKVHLRTPVKKSNDTKLPTLKNTSKLAPTHLSGSTVRSSNEGPMRSFSTSKKVQETKIIPTDKRPNPSIPKDRFQLGGATGIIHAEATDIFKAVGSHTMAGRSEGKAKTNQDSYFAHTSMMNNPEMALFAVFDGHGLHGHRVSNFLISNIIGTKV